MKPELTEERLMDYLYGECPPDEKEAIEAHLAAHPEAREKLAALSSVSHTLQAWPDEDPDLDLVFVRERESFWKTLIPAWLTRRPWGALTAAGLATAVLLIALLDVEMTYTDGVFTLQAGRQSASREDPLEAPVTRREFAEIQKQSLELIETMLRASEVRQRQERNTALTQLAQGLELQRQQDLQLVGQGLRGVDQSSAYRSQQTGEMLRQLLNITSGEGRAPQPVKFQK